MPPLPEKRKRGTGKGGFLPVQGERVRIAVNHLGIEKKFGGKEGGEADERLPFLLEERGPHR